MTYLTTVLTDQKTNVSFQKTIVTSSQNVTNSFALVEGGQMSYTPSSSSAEVMVEFTTTYGRKDPDVSIIFRLQIGDAVESLGDVVSNNIDYYNGFGTTTTSSTTNISDLITLKYKLAGWSGEKVLQVQCRTYNSSLAYESIVNGTRAKTTTNILLFNPFMTIYEV